MTSSLGRNTRIRSWRSGQSPSAKDIKYMLGQGDIELNCRRIFIADRKATRETHVAFVYLLNVLR